MESSTAMDAQKKSPVQGMIDTIKQVIVNPAEFYRTMPKTGGLGDPLVFAVVLGLVSGILQAILGLIQLSPLGLSAIIVVPIGVLIGGFIGAAIMFVIWKLMGSAESYETAYRCGAYSMAIHPITVVAGLIPMVGGLVGVAWMLYLLVMASVEVHKIPAKKAWLVFGIIAAVLALLSLSAQAGARKMNRAMSDYQKEMGQMGISTDKDMSPEDAGKAAAAFMKAMQEQSQKQAQKANEE